MTESGIFRDVPYSEYATWEAINSGIVSWGRKSMLHMRAAVNGDIANDDTRDRKFGRAVHVRLLEPDRYTEDVVIAGSCCALLKSGERKGQPCGLESTWTDGEYWYCGKHKSDECHQPVDYVSRGEAERIERLAASLHGHDVMRLFRRSGWSECSVRWERRGFAMKGRLDRFTSVLSPTILDLKKVRVGMATRDLCEKSIANYGYHRQAYMYVDAIETITGSCPQFVWVFIEDGPPFDVQVIPADQETLTIGRYEVDQVLMRWRRAIDTDHYPGYVYDPRNVREGGLPSWYRTQWHNHEVRDEQSDDERNYPSGNEPSGDGDFDDED